MFSGFYGGGAGVSGRAVARADYLPRCRDVIGTGAYNFALARKTALSTSQKNGVTLFTDACCEYGREGKAAVPRDYIDFDVSLTETETGRESLTVTLRAGDAALYALTEQYYDTFARRLSPRGKREMRN